jgi:selenoprotein W-related protein
MVNVVKIVYCRPCGYIDRALDLARDVLSYFQDVQVVLSQGEKGIFDVYLNDERIFSRYEEKRFPENNEILMKISKVSKVSA